jgi:hypothetical protein
MPRLKNTFTPPDWNRNKDGAKPVKVASDSYKPKTWASYWVDVVFSDNLYYLWAPMTVIGIVIGSNVELIGNFKHVPLFCLGLFFGLTVYGFLEEKMESALEDIRLEDEDILSEEENSDSRDLPYDDYHYNPGFSSNPSNFYHHDD